MQQAGEQSSKDIVQRSRALLTKCKKVIYFANGASLTSRAPAQKRQRTRDASPSEGGVDDDDAAAAGGSGDAGSAGAAGTAGDIVLDEGSLQTLASRFDFLDSVLPDGVEVMLQISRCPQGTVHSAVAVRDAVAAALRGGTAAKETGNGMDASDGGGPAFADGSAAVDDAAVRAPEPSAVDSVPAQPPHQQPQQQQQQEQRELPGFLTHVLQALGTQKSWKPGLVGPAYSSDHLDEEGNLDPEAICTKESIFRRALEHIA